MKKIYIALSFVLAITASNAQNKDTKIADKLYQNYNFIDASKAYLKLNDLGKADTYVFKQLGDCYYNVFNSLEAEKWYSKSITDKVQDAETYFRFAQMLKANNKYSEADAQMKTFATLAPSDKRALAANDDANYLNKLLGKAKSFDVKSLEFNSKNSDFGAFLKNDVIYFASGRNATRKNYEWNDEPFLDIFKTDFKDGKANTTAIPALDLNTKYHEGPVSITSDGNTIYFSRESFFDNKFVKTKDKKQKLGKMNIYKATNNGGKWENISSVSFNSKEYNTSSPSISKDGKTLFFISDMPGTLGKTDVWKASVNEDGTFGLPTNLGDKVNTEGNELSAFIADDNMLYFASNGKKGLGGLDVFVANLDKDTEAINLGKPVNSEKDDFGFTFNQQQNTAFLSSNRDGGQGSDDIYMALPVCIVDLIATAHDTKSGLTIANANVTILDENKNVVSKSVTNGMGKATFALECNKNYFINVDKDGYDSSVFPMDKSKNGELTINTDLKPTEAIVTETEVILRDINFEFNKSNITQEGAFELDKLVEVLNKYPEMVIFAKSHTDSKGSDKYNMSLSERRAKSTVQYVVSKGILAERITGKGFGESELKVACGESCTDEQNAQNRRSEFMIIKK